MADSREIRDARFQELKTKLMNLVDSSTVPSGILHAPPMQSATLEQARGAASDPPLRRQDWREVYFNLHKGAVPTLQAAASINSLDQIENRAAQVRESGAIPLAIGHYHYHAPTDMFVNRMRNYLEQGGTLPLPDPQKPESVLHQKTAFFAAPLLKQRARASWTQGALRGPEEPLSFQHRKGAGQSRGGHGRRKGLPAGGARPAV